MAEIFGIPYASPDEINYQQQQQFQQALSQATDPAQKGFIAQQQAIYNLFGNPELNKAKKTQEALAEVSGMEKEEGESDFDFGVRQAEAVRLAATKAKNTEMALAANEQVLALRKQELERRKLLATVGSQEQSLADKIQESKDLKTPVLFGYKADGTRHSIKELPIGASQEEKDAVLARAEALHTQFTNFDWGNRQQVLTLDDIEAGLTAGGRSKTEDKGYRNQLTQAKVLVRSLNDIRMDLQNSPFALSPKVSDMSKFTETLRGGANALRDVVVGRTPLTGDEARKLAEQYDRRIEANLDSDARFAKTVENAGVLRARVTALAYQLAKTLDPGGRLSDQDIEMAKAMMLGNGTPQEIERLWTKRVNETHWQVEMAVDLAMAGKLGPEAKVEAERYMKSKAETIAGLRELAIQAAALREQDFQAGSGMVSTTFDQDPSRVPGGQQSGGAISFEIIP